MVTKYDFLAELHNILRPQTYLEIGVQTGRSLAVVRPETNVIGVDPQPLISRSPHGGQAVLHVITSDDFFRVNSVTPIDLAFIDGMHLVEFALRDFMNVEAWAGSNCVVVFDDVLPYSWAIAGREPLPGDWTGDVWKMWPILRKWRPDLEVHVVDVETTGALVVWNLDNQNQHLRNNYDAIVGTWAKDVDEQPWVLERVGARKPEEIYELIRG